MGIFLALGGLRMPLQAACGPVVETPQHDLRFQLFC